MTDLFKQKYGSSKVPTGGIWTSDIRKPLNHDLPILSNNDTSQILYPESGEYILPVQS